MVWFELYAVHSRKFDQSSYRARLHCLGALERFDLTMYSFLWSLFLFVGASVALLPQPALNNGPVVIPGAFIYEFADNAVSDSSFKPLPGI